jgi:hypothetical protein
MANAPSPKEIGDRKLDWCAGPRANLLEALSGAAFEAIKVIEHERFGIRDGDARWRGRDKIDAMTTDLIDLCRSLKREYKEDQNDEIPI